MSNETRHTLARIFMSGRGVPRPGERVNLERLERLLADAAHRGREAWPKIGMTAEEFVTQLARLGQTNGETDELGHADLWLACAALGGDDLAVAALHELVRDLACQALPSTRFDDATRQDVIQKVESRLLIGTPTSQPALINYQGLGPLRAWLRVGLVREGLRQRKATEAEKSLEDGVLRTLAIDSADPEMSYLKRHYLDAFHRAFRQALSELNKRDRNLLRYLVLDQLAVENVAALYNVNRTTVWRWMAAIRQSLLQRTRRDLRQTLGISDPELDSIMRLIQSRITITLNALGSVKTDHP